MSDIMTCPGCQTNLRVKPEYAGRRIKCPKCQTAMAIPAAEVALEVVEEIEVLDEIEPTADVQSITKGRRQTPQSRSSVKKSRRSRDEDDEDDYEEEERDIRRPKRRSSRGDHPCPRCGSTKTEDALYTFWGSFYGPALCNHVRCRECGATFNGQTGGSNIVPAIFFVTIPLVLILGIGAFIFYILFMRGVLGS